MNAFKNMNLQKDVTMEQAQHIWQHLDELSQTDPKGYQENFKNLVNEHKRMEATSRIVEPGIAIYSTGTLCNGSNIHVLNIGRSRAVPSQTDDQNVPVIMSNARIHVDGTGSVSNVYDVVFSYKVLDRCKTDGVYQKEVLDLAISCVKETFNFDLDKPSFRFEESAYFGQYGWNDKTGLPLDSNTSIGKDKIPFGSNGILSSPLDYTGNSLSTSIPEAAEPLLGKVDYADSASSSYLPTEIFNSSMAGGLNINSHPYLTPRETQLTSQTQPRVLIEELCSAPASPIQSVHSDCDLPSIKPKCATKQNNTHIDIIVLLPGIISCKEIIYTLESSRLTLHACSEHIRDTKYHLELVLPVPIIPRTEASRFVIAKERLVIHVEKAQQY
ncbi:hypothetical protein BASA61_009278 [Batrachochytrium salamandrivorans]|nr:hypothetical protein BASA61_009278 [Batrachochytrium salamandrivorans]KAH9251263.1 hypothetical protein BASA81_010885 [Batrachochytrium salamandrivorans]KAJ1344042.1 hypothetical protein BSLG_001182 [Batrachochytrium salamandrivorans]